MNTAENLYARIDAYLDGTLSKTDRMAFEADMAASPALKEEVELQKMVHILILEKGLADIRIKVGEDLNKSVGYPWKKIIISSILFTFLSIGIYWFTTSLNKETSAVLNTSDTIQQIHSDSVVTMENKETAPYIQKKKSTTVSKSQFIEKDTSLYKGFAYPEEIRLKTQPFLTDTYISRDFLKEKHIEKKVEEKTAIPCPDILFNVHTEASCTNSNSGSVQILLSSILGGQAPYRYTIDGKSNSLLNDLAAGTYEVKVVDSRGCNSEKTVDISEKSCTVFKDYSFRPEAETLKLPFAEMESGTLSIMDKSGKVVYKTDLINGLPNEWNGRSMNGSSLEMGSYLYIATFTNGESRQGYIILLH